MTIESDKVLARIEARKIRMRELAEETRTSDDFAWLRDRNPEFFAR